PWPFSACPALSPVWFSPDDVSAVAGCSLWCWCRSIVEPIRNSRPEPTSSRTSAARRRVKCVLIWNLLRFEDEERKLLGGPPELRAHYSLERRRASLWVAKCERRNPRQIAHLRERPGRRRLARDAGAGERAHEPLDHAQERARDQQRKQPERQLEQQAEQETRLQCSLERERLCVEQTLAQLLRHERERRHDEEHPRGDVQVPPPP